MCTTGETWWAQVIQKDIHAFETFQTTLFIRLLIIKKGVPSAESSRSVRGLGKGVSGKPYPRLCDARRPQLEPGTFRSQAVRLYRLHQARPSYFP